MASAPRFELLESKLLVPQARGAVSRDDIISRLEDPRSAPVVVVSAAPGWGKTTLIAQWAARSDRAFAWVEIDEHDNDPVVLLTYVAAAFDRISPIHPAVWDALAEPGPSLETTVVPRLAAAMTSMARPFVLVLSSLHHLGNQECLDAIAALVGHVPAGSQLVLSARGVPPVPLAALRARDLVLEIGADDLRLDDAQARQLLGDAGLDLADRDGSELAEQTEGWAAGLYLAALSSRIEAEGTERRALSGSDLLISDYFRTELLAHLPSHDLRFLMRTSVLPQMCGPLCDAVLETTGSAYVLDSLARSNKFLVALDATGDWYRYHHLLQDLLRDDLERTEPDAVPQLLARAAAWSETNGRREEAIGFALKSGDIHQVAGLVERCALPMYASGQAAILERCFAWLEARGAFEPNAAVAVIGSLVAAASGRPAQAERWARAAECGTYEGTLPDGTASLETWLALLRALRCSGGVAEMRADAEHAHRNLALRSPHRPNALLILAISRWLADDVDEADALFADVAEEALELGAQEAAAVALAERAAIALARGDWTMAEGFVDSALLVITDARTERYPTSSLTYALAARVALHRGDAGQAHELLARSHGLRQGLTFALPYLAIQVRLELSRACLAGADGPTARAMLGEIEGVLHRRPDLGTLLGQVQELRSRLQTVGATAPMASTLSEAELRILPQLASHLSFREIGASMYLSRHTVKSHAVAIYRKLNVSSRNGAVARAEQLGLL